MNDFPRIPLSQQRYWLPEDCTLNLTQLELGALAGILIGARRVGFGSIIVSKPGPQGEPVDISIIDLLIEKVELCIEKRRAQ